MKQQILNKLTSSKNERLIFEVIWSQTIEQGKVNRLILNHVFYDAGVSTRKAANLAANRLEEKGLIFKRLCPANNYDFDVYRYQVNKSGCSHFLRGDV